MTKKFHKCDDTCKINHKKKVSKTVVPKVDKKFVETVFGNETARKLKGMVKLYRSGEPIDTNILGLSKKEMKLIDKIIQG